MEAFGRRIAWTLLLAAALLGGYGLFRGLRASPGPLDAPGPRAAAAPRPSLLTAPLPPPAGSLTIRGRVLGPDGPVAQAAIIATGPGGEDLSALPSGCSEREKLLDGRCTGAIELLSTLADQHRGEAPAVARVVSRLDGSFELTGLLPGRVTLWAESAGRGIALRRNVEPGAQDVELRLEAGRVLSGRVVGDRGEPLAGVPVTAVSPEHRRYFDGQSDAEGRFLIGPVPSAAYTLVAIAEGRLPARAGADEAQPPTLCLYTPLRLSGSVVRDGRPVPGASVQAQGSAGVARTLADGQGHFELSDLPPDVYGVTATADLGHGTELVKLAPGASRSGLEVHLTDGAEISGAVLDEQDRPLPGALIRVTGVTGDQHPPEARTGADGRYRVGPLAPGRYQLWAQAREHRPSEWRSVELAPGQRTAVDFRLPSGVVLRGVVLDVEGKPVAGALVEVTGTVSTRLAEEPRYFSQVGTNDSGAFESEGLPPGDYQVTVMHPRFLRLTADARAPGPPARLVLRRGGVLQGQVVDERDRPMKGVSVRADLVSRAHVADGVNGFRQATTDAEGHFLLEGLAPGGYRVEATLQGAVGRLTRASAEVSADVPAELRIRFGEDAPLTGRVVDPDKKPIEGAQLAVTPAAASGNPDATRLVTSGPDGRFELHDVEPGLYHFTSRAAGFHAVELPEAEPGGEPVTLVLERDARIHGRVLHENGRPFTTFSIDGANHSDPDGSFELPDLTEPRAVTFSAPGAAPRQVSLDPQAVRDAPVEVVLRAGHPLSGTVLDERTRMPVADALVWLQLYEGQVTGEGLPPMARSGPDGRFVLPNVDGAGTVVVKKPGFREARQDLDGSEASVSLSLVALASVYGTVKGTPRAPLESLSLTAVGPTSQTVTPKPDGTYELTDLEAGSYQILLMSDDDPLVDPPAMFVTAARVTVRAGERVPLDLRPRTGGITVRIPLTVPRSFDPVMLVPDKLPPGLRTHEELVEVLLHSVDRLLLPSARNPFIFENVPPGHYTLVVESGAGEPALVFRELDVPAGAGPLFEPTLSVAPSPGR